MTLTDASQQSSQRGVVTVMFTDIVESTRLKGLMEADTSTARDASYVSRIKHPHDRLVLDCVQASRGSIINTTGDGYYCAFSDAEAAVLCALKIQDALEEKPIKTPLGDLAIRIGLHTGTAELINGQYFGLTVDKAARIQQRAAAGEVLVSRETRVICGDHLRGVHFDHAGLHELKGLQSEPLFRVCTDSSALVQNVAEEPVRGISLKTESPAAPRFQNPYNFSGTATSKTFKGREGELDDLLDSIETGTHTAVFGLQRMGKTSLIKEGLEERLQRRPDLQREVLIADIDLMKLGGDEVTYKDLFHAIIQAITEKLLASGIGKRVDGLRTLTNELWAAGRYERGDRTQFFATVSKVLSGLSDVARRRIVLFIDEFSELRKVLERNRRALASNPLRTKNILPHEMYIDVPFVHHLSSLLKERKLQEKFTLIVAVRPFMAEYDTREGLQILKLMKPITLYYLEEPAARALITEPLAGQIDYAGGVADYLYQLSAGHPYLLQFMLKNVVDKVKREKRRTVTLEDVQHFEEKMLTQGPAFDAQFEVVISDYSVAEVMHPQEALLGKGTLALIAKLGEEDPDGWISDDRLFEGLGTHNIPEEKAAELLSQLVRTKILDEESAAGAMRYRIAIPLLRKRFIRQNLYLKYFR